ncbi:hypothetical protein QE152_g9921 [Popillia japonica]|uniref:Uncharacterized protein n=1 Tax=Popillia japonica TaxID=7064 RepID=A0AAW1LWW1_POPJA
MCVINGTYKYFPRDYNVLGQTTEIVRTANREVQPTAAISCLVLPTKTKPKENKCRYEKDFEPEENDENCLCCLKYDNLTAEDFDQCWKACTSYRLCEIKRFLRHNLFWKDSNFIKVRRDIAWYIYY